jgi:GNAT superfamily N-acetyltransferase
LKNIKTIIASQLDENQVGFLVKMINDVYLESEKELWKDEHERTNKQRLLEIIGKGELLLAVEESDICGCIHLEPMSKSMSKFKMLVANPIFKGKGIGSILVDFAESEVRKTGATKMQLELLVPTGFVHPDKVFLSSWYTRIGYEKVAEESVDAAHDGLSKLLKTGCVAEIYHKDL